MHEIEVGIIGGIALCDDLFQAKRDKRLIAIMTAGLALTKPHNIGAMAETFREGGISASAVDHRC